MSLAKVDGVFLEDLAYLQDQPIATVLVHLEARGMLDEEAKQALQEIMLLKSFCFHFHAQRCSQPPITKHWSGADMQWKRRGSIYVWQCSGKQQDGALHPSLEPDASWCEICLAAAE